MDESYTNIPTSYLPGSVPAVVNDDKENITANYEVSEANMQTFPPANGGDKGRGGYQTIGSSSEAFERQPSNNWRGAFSIASYTQYFNVDTDVVWNRMLSSLQSFYGDFFSKIDANPDLLLSDDYGPIWISTTLVFMLASLGNCATYLMQKRTDSSTSWRFNVNNVNVAACSVYGYSAVVPLMPLLIPVEILRWITIILAGGASSSFVALNLKSYIEGDLTLVVVAAFFLQLALAFFIKGFFR